MSDPALLPAATRPEPATATVAADAMKQLVDQLREALPKLQEINPAYGNGLGNFLDPVLEVMARVGVCGSGERCGGP